jgi:hypothetical protein
LFYVRKKLAFGAIRFGVNPRAKHRPDPDPSLSTGPTGEFIRRRGGGGFFFADNSRFSDPSLPATRTIDTTPFWSTLPHNYTHIAMMSFGGLLILLGLLVLVRNGAIGLIEIIIGLGLIATPIVITAQERKQIREREARERAEREAVENRNREMLASYTAALERARNERTDESFSSLYREYQLLHAMPYEVWAKAAYRMVLNTGFDELARGGDVGALMDRASTGAGMSEEDAEEVKRDLYRIVLWHLLADDRVNEAQQPPLRALREKLAIDDLDTDAIDSFVRLRRAELTPITCTKQLGFREECVYEAGPLHVTSKRVLVDNGKKRIEIPLAAIDEVTADVDSHAIEIRTSKPIRVEVDDPIYSAAVIDLAEQLDQKPKGFA